MKWNKYEIQTTTNMVDLIGELLYELDITGFEVSDNVPLSAEDEAKMFTGIPAELPPDDGHATITFYTEGENTPDQKEFYSTGSSLRDNRLDTVSPATQPEELISRLQSRMKECSIPQASIVYSLQDDSQWKDKWKDSFRAFRITDDIIIKPIWEDIPDFATPKDHILEIDPGSAFGTGTHETTKLSLFALKKHLTPETTILDAGCGSGILAISALLSGAHSAFCLDIDPSAVNGTNENAELNHLTADQIQAIHANILEDSSEITRLHPEPFDIAVANILADVIVSLADVIGTFIKPGGLFISSGILAEKADIVEKAILENNFEIIEKNTMGEWVSFTAKKPH